VTDPRREQTLEDEGLRCGAREATCSFQLSGSNVTKATDSERGQRLCEGKKP